jgi:hypothetical protein
MLGMDTALVQTPPAAAIDASVAVAAYQPLPIPIRLDPYRNKQSQLHPDTDKKKVN